MHLGIDFGSQSRALKMLRPGMWSRPARRWVSVTPVCLDRFPSVRLSEGSRGLDEAAGIIANSCRTVGLPDPESIETSLHPRLRGSRPVRGFPGLQLGGRNRAAVHATITWSDPVAGPLVLGAGRYLGYGLMFPVGSHGDWDEVQS